MKKCINFIMIVFMLFLSVNLVAEGMDVTVEAGFKPGYIASISFQTSEPSIVRGYYSAYVDTSFGFGDHALDVGASYLMFPKSEDDVSIFDHIPGLGLAFGYLWNSYNLSRGVYLNASMGFGDEGDGGFFLYPNVYYGFSMDMPFTDSFKAVISIDLGSPIGHLDMDSNGNLKYTMGLGLFIQFGLLFGWTF